MRPPDKHTASRRSRSLRVVRGTAPAAPAPVKPYVVPNLPGYEVMERGVYIPRYVSEGGHNIVYAIDSRGRRIGEIVVSGLTTLESAERILWALLDERDPTLSREQHAIADLYVC